MMLKKSISRSTPTDVGQDQAQLFALGMDDVRRFARNVWTDHNTHDPGITILELLCYALTDLSYRARFPLQDLLATALDNPSNMARQFYTAKQVLPNRPVTQLDYRKLLIDLKGVANAWISPAPVRYFADAAEKRLRRDNPQSATIRPVDIHGLYNVRVDYSDEVKTEADRTQVNASALAVLQANRNLCEDFVSVEAIETQKYSLCAEIELTSEADEVTVAAQIALRIDQYLAPPLFNYRLDEMLQRRHPNGQAYTVDEIFDGPQLVNGFFDSSEVANAELRSEVRLSDMISLIMDIKGVSAVMDIVVNELAMNPDGTEVEPVKAIASNEKWRLRVPMGRRPRLSDKHGRLVFYKRNLPLRAPDDKVALRLAELKLQQRGRLSGAGTEDIAIPLGRDRQTASYRSFQNDFPAVYGLSDAGLLQNASPLRRAQVLELKAYLLFFDSVMANYFAQLSHVHELFSRDPATPIQSYFTQIVRSISDYKKIYADADVDGDGDVRLPPLEKSDEAIGRRNRFLDHLLARVAEDFSQYVNVMRSAFGHSQKSMIDVKTEFLKDYPDLGAERGSAYNHWLTEPERIWNSAGVSGLERRLARLLRLRNVSRRNLSAIATDEFATVEQSSSGGDFRFRIQDRRTGKILLSSNDSFATQDAARAKMLQTIERGQIPNAYERLINVSGEHFFNIVDEDGQVLAHPIENFDTLEALEHGIAELVDYLGLHYSGEGMYLLENILLRPEGDDDPFLPICADPNCTDCVDDDPYSYRVHFIFPAYAGRFQNRDFRVFVEETVRQETPAHILPKICWVDVDQMREFEQLYHDWLIDRHSDSDSNRREKLRALIDALSKKIRNVYPKSKLHACDGGDAQPPFILGRSQLGSSD